jgi:hypothetical protein
MKALKLAVVALVCVLLVACGGTAYQSNDARIAQQQEDQIAEAYAQVPPAKIVNWNERRMANLIQEMRDKENLQTWTYTKNMDGKYTFVCESVSYGLPYNTRTNNPMHYEYLSTRSGVWNPGDATYTTDKQGNRVWGEHHIVPQAEPNGLFIPDSAKGTWNLCRGPEDGKIHVTYQEEDVAVFPYRLPPAMVEGFHPAPLPPVKK